MYTPANVKTRFHRVLLDAWVGLAVISAILGAMTAPAAVDVSVSPPGGLSPADTPQMVLLTFDDAVGPDIYALVQTLTANRTNPNGGGLQFTFYIWTQWTHYSLINKLHAAGHEIAIHTMTHTTDTSTTDTVWRGEIAGAKQALVRYAKIPPEDIVGFRAPFLKYNTASFRILAEQGYLYDSSIYEAPGGGSLSTGAGALIWPYTLDHGVQQDTWTGERPTEDFPGLFEVPLWAQVGTNGAAAATMDPPGSDAEVLALLQYNFTARYEGNRAPLGIYLHGGSWTSRATVLTNFIAWAQSHSNVWFVSARAAAEYTRSPCGNTGAMTFPPFLTRAAIPWPDSDIYTNNFAQGTVITCGERPPEYPAPDTVYIERVPLSGGAADVTVTGLWSTGFNATLTLTNTTAAYAPDWTLEFSLANAEVTWLSGGNWTRTGHRIQVRPQNGAGLAAGNVVAVNFGGTRTADLNFEDLALTLYVHQPMRPDVLSVAPAATGLDMEWAESAFGYVIEESTPPFLNWTPAGTVHGRTRWSPSAPPSGPARAYRVRTTE